MPGTALYIAFNAFLLRAGVEASFAPVRGLTMPEVAEGRIHATLHPLAVTLPFARKGSVRVLATPSRARAAAAPGIPTAAEAGFPDFWVEGLLGVFGWRGMPDTAREEFSAEARAVLAEPALAERYAAAGLLARGSTPAAFEVELDRHRARWTALAREFGAKPNARAEVF
jgi:tripartite-type tricarboxylate transporter receptor subunit TctC